MNADEFRQRVIAARAVSGLDRETFGRMIEIEAKEERGFGSATLKRIELGHKQIHSEAEQRRWAELVAKAAGVKLTSVLGEEGPDLDRRLESMTLKIEELQAVVERHETMLKALARSSASSRARTAAKGAGQQRDGTPLRGVETPVDQQE